MLTEIKTLLQKVILLSEGECDATDNVKCVHSSGPCAVPHYLDCHLLGRLETSSYVPADICTVS